MTWWGNEFIETDGLSKEKKPEVIRKNNLILENVHFPFSDINNIWIDSLNGQGLWKNIMEKLRKIEYKGSLALEIDSQFIDIAKEYTAEGYLLEAKNRVYKLMDI